MKLKTVTTSRKRSIYHSQSAYDILEADKEKNSIKEHSYKWWTSGKIINYYLFKIRHFFNY